ncbi:hypothetical protein [Nocardiopsis baichengensis]
MRPDGFIAWRTSAPTVEEGLVPALRTILCRAGT